MSNRLGILMLLGLVAGCSSSSGTQNGTQAATGGGTNTGGSLATGGLLATGGNTATGGVVATGGSSTLGGTAAAGGTLSVSTGGATNAATGGGTAGGTGGGTALATIQLDPASTCNITTPAIWTKGVYDATNCLVVEVSSTLSIDAGAIIKFKTPGHMHVADTGALTATGTASDPIIFTAATDDAHGGDTNADGPSMAELGDWGCPGDCGDLDLFGSNSNLDHVQFLYGNNGLWVQAASVTVTNSIFAHNATYGMLLSGDYDVGSTVLTGNAFFDNAGYPLSLGAFVSLDSTNVFHDPQSPDTTNQQQCIELTATLQDSAVSLGVTELAFYGNFAVNSTLTVADGVTFKSALGGEIDLSNEGTIVNAENAIFTSPEDDSAGGDCTGDGDVPPNEGDWKGIWINSTDASDWAAPTPNIRFTDQIDYPGTLPLH